MIIDSFNTTVYQSYIALTLGLTTKTNYHNILFIFTKYLNVEL